MVLKVFILILMPLISAFIINNKYINQDGLKVFTVTNEIKNNNCSCACNCLSEQLPFDKPISAPSPPIADAPKQFLIKKVIRNNDCNCACSCVPNKQSENESNQKTNKSYNEVRDGILDELKTTIENYYISTTIPSPTESTEKVKFETKIYYYTTTSPLLKGRSQTRLPLFSSTISPKRDEIISNYWTQPPKFLSTGYATEKIKLDWPKNELTTTGYATGPTKNVWSTNEVTTQTPFTLPTFPTIQWPFPTIANPFLSQTTTQVGQTSNFGSHTAQKLNPLNSWNEQKTKSSGITGQNPSSQLPNSAQTSIPSSQWLSSSTQNQWSNTAQTSSPSSQNTQNQWPNTAQNTQNQWPNSAQTSIPSSQLPNTGSSTQNQWSNSQTSNPSSQLPNSAQTLSPSSQWPNTGSSTQNQWPNSQTLNSSGQWPNAQTSNSSSQWPNSAQTTQNQLPNSAQTSNPSTQNQWPNVQTSSPSTQNQWTDFKSTNPSTQNQEQLNESKNPWSSRNNPSQKWQQSNGLTSQTEIWKSDSSTQQPLNFQPGQSTSKNTSPTIATDDEISTQTHNFESTAPFFNKNFENLQTTNDFQSSNSNPQTSISWSKQPPNENPLENPGLEISPGSIDATFTRTVAITSKKLNTQQPISSESEISGDTRATTISNKIAEFNDQPATSITKSTISPEFKEKVHNLLERLRQQLQKMKNEQASTLAPGNDQKELKEMRVDLQEILSNNSLNDVPNKDDSGKGKLMKKLDSIREALDRMKKMTTQVLIQTTLPPSKFESTMGSGIAITEDGNLENIKSTLISTQPSSTMNSIINEDNSQSISTQTTSEPIQKSIINERNFQSTSKPTQKSTINEDNSLIQSTSEPIQSTIDSIQSTFKPTQSTIEENSKSTSEPIQSTIQDNSIEQNSTPQIITINAVKVPEKNEFDAPITTEIVDNEQPTTQVPENQGFLHRLHDKLLKLKENLEEMRKQNSIESNPTEVHPDFQHLNTQLANIKNSIDLKSNMENSDESMKKRMQGMLDQLKRTLNKMQNEQLEDKRTTIELTSLSTTLTTTPISKIDSSSFETRRLNEDLTTTPISRIESSTFENRLVNEDLKGTPIITTTPINKIEHFESSTISSKLTTHGNLISSTNSLLKESSTTIKQEKIDIDFENENTPESATPDSQTIPFLTTKQQTTSNDVNNLITEIEGTIKSTTSKFTTPEQSTTKNIPPEAETEAKQTTIASVSGTSSSIPQSSTLKLDESTKLIEEVMSTTMNPITLSRRPAFIQQNDELENTETTTLLGNKDLKSPSTNSPLNNEESTTINSKSEDLTTSSKIGNLTTYSSKNQDLTTASLKIEDLTTFSSKIEDSTLSSSTENAIIFTSTQNSFDSEEVTDLLSELSTKSLETSTVPKTNFFNSEEVTDLLSTKSTLPSEILETSTKSTNIRRKPLNDDGRRGLEITKILRPNQAAKGLDFNQDEEDETFIDRGDDESKKVSKLTTIKNEEVSNLATSTVKNEEASKLTTVKNEEVFKLTTSTVKNRGVTKLTALIVATGKNEESEEGDSLENTSIKSKKSSFESDEEDSINTLGPSTTTRRPNSRRKTTKPLPELTTMESFGHHRTIGESRLKLIDSIINHSTRLVGESIKGGSVNSVNGPQLTQNLPNELLQSGSQLKTEILPENLIPSGIQSRSEILPENLIPSGIHSKDVENWIRKAPQKVENREDSVSKIEESVPQIQEFSNTQLPQGSKFAEPGKPFGVEPPSDSQLFSLINKLMQMQAPVTAKELIPNESSGITLSISQPKSKPIERVPSISQPNAKPIERTPLISQPKAKPIERIITTEHEIRLQPPQIPNKNVRIQMKTNTTLSPQAMEKLHSGSTHRQKSTNNRNFRKNKDSREFYDDYQDHDPTLAPDTPTRTPKVVKYLVTSTIQSRPSRIDDDGVKKQEVSFSVDSNPNVDNKDERQLMSESIVNEEHRKNEILLIQRLDEARRLREQLEKAQLQENAADAGIHFQSNAGIRQQIEDKLTKLAQAERWHRTLLERAKLKNTKLHDNDVNVPPNAKPITTSTTQENSEFPSHCQPVRRFLRMFRVDDPRVWIRENCQQVREFYPGASCGQIENLLSACFTKQA